MLKLNTSFFLALLGGCLAAAIVLIAFLVCRLRRHLKTPPQPSPVLEAALDSVLRAPELRRLAEKDKPWGPRAPPTPQTASPNSTVRTNPTDRPKPPWQPPADWQEAARRRRQEWLEAARAKEWRIDDDDARPPRLVMCGNISLNAAATASPVKLADPPQSSLPRLPPRRRSSPRGRSPPLRLPPHPPLRAHTAALPSLVGLNKSQLVDTRAAAAVAEMAREARQAQERLSAAHLVLDRNRLLASRARVQRGVADHAHAPPHSLDELRRERRTHAALESPRARTLERRLDWLLAQADQQRRYDA